MLQKHSPRLETRFAETVLISPLWASFTLWLPSTAPVTKTGQREKWKENKKRGKKKKKKRYSILVRGQKEVLLVEGIHL